MAQGFRVGAVLPEDPSWIPRTHVRQLTTSSLVTPPLTLVCTCTHAHTPKEKFK